MTTMPRVSTIYLIEDGVLRGTELSPIMAFLSVKYPHRKTKDLYVPPSKIGDKEIKIWHCCQKGCLKPDFEGGLDALIKHLMLHKGRLLKPWNKKQQSIAPRPAVKLPLNPWDKRNEDRRFCVELYIASAERYLRKQGLEIWNEGLEG